MMSLHYAASKGHFGITQLLLERHCPVNYHSAYDFTPLAEAVMNSHYEIVQLLVTHCADLNDETEDGQTPLYLAMVVQDENSSSFLVRAGCDLRLYTWESGEHRDEILHLAITCHLYDLSRLLVLSGCRVSKDHIDLLTNGQFSNKNFLSWITEDKLSRPMSLKRLCRISIRNHVRLCVPNLCIFYRLDRLPIPKLLRDYLKFEIL